MSYSYIFDLKSNKSCLNSATFFLKLNQIVSILIVQLRSCHLPAVVYIYTDYYINYY